MCRIPQHQVTSHHIKQLVWRRLPRRTHTAFTSARDAATADVMRCDVMYRYLHEPTILGVFRIFSFVRQTLLQTNLQPPVSFFRINADTQTARAVVVSMCEQT